MGLPFNLIRGGDPQETEYKLEWNPVWTRWSTANVDTGEDAQVADPEYNIEVISGEPNNWDGDPYQVRITITCPTVGATPIIAYGSETWAPSTAWDSTDDPVVFNIISVGEPSVPSGDPGDTCTYIRDCRFVRYQKSGLRDSRILVLVMTFTQELGIENGPVWFYFTYKDEPDPGPPPPTAIYSDEFKVFQDSEPLNVGWVSAKVNFTPNLVQTYDPPNPAGLYEWDIVTTTYHKLHITLTGTIPNDWFLQHGYQTLPESITQKFAEIDETIDLITTRRVERAYANASLGTQHYTEIDSWDFDIPCKLTYKVVSEELAQIENGEVSYPFRLVTRVYGDLKVNGRTFTFDTDDWLSEAGVSALNCIDGIDQGVKADFLSADYVELPVFMTCSALKAMSRDSVTTIKRNDIAIGPSEDLLIEAKDLAGAGDVKGRIELNQNELIIGAAMSGNPLWMNGNDDYWDSAFQELSGGFTYKWFEPARNVVLSLPEELQENTDFAVQYEGNNGINTNEVIEIVFNAENNFAHQFKGAQEVLFTNLVVMQGYTPNCEAGPEGALYDATTILAVISEIFTGYGAMVGDIEPFAQNGFLIHDCVPRGRYYVDYDIPYVLDNEKLQLTSASKTALGVTGSGVVYVQDPDDSVPAYNLNADDTALLESTVEFPVATKDQWVQYGAVTNNKGFTNLRIDWDCEDPDARLILAPCAAPETTGEQVKWTLRSGETDIDLLEPRVATADQSAWGYAGETLPHYLIGDVTWYVQFTGTSPVTINSITGISKVVQIEPVLNSNTDEWEVYQYFSQILRGKYPWASASETPADVSEANGDWWTGEGLLPADRTGFPSITAYTFDQYSSPQVFAYIYDADAKYVESDILYRKGLELLRSDAGCVNARYKSVIPGDLIWSDTFINDSAVVLRVAAGILSSAQGMSCRVASGRWRALDLLITQSGVDNETIGGFFTSAGLLPSVAATASATTPNQTLTTDVEDDVLRRQAHIIEVCVALYPIGDTDELAKRIHSYSLDPEYGFDVEAARDVEI